MIKQEAKTIYHLIMEVIENPQKQYKILNIGSKPNDSSGSAQKIPANLFQNLLRNRPKISVMNTDFVKNSGVDAQMDICDENSIKTIKEYAPDIILLSNLLEHVEDKLIAVNNIYSSMNHECILIISGPRFYPYHEDPIDNGFRPSKKKLQKLVKNLFRVEYFRFQFCISGYHIGEKSFKLETRDWLYQIKSMVLFPNRISMNRLHYLFPVVTFCARLIKL